jgi:hypothetical protein
MMRGPRMGAAMNISHLLTGLASGFLVGLALASHAISRAAVIGLVACVVTGAIIADGVEGYLSWFAYIPTELMKFTTFWICMSIGCLVGGALGWLVRAKRLR